MTQGASHTYPGAELDLFADAVVWKGYIRTLVAPFIKGCVLEVGAGIGSTTAALHSDSVDRWLCLEPDGKLADRLAQRVERGSLPRTCEVQCGTLADIGTSFDCILYMDVLEHIESDAIEVSRAVQRLRPGGHLVVLAPAHPWLYTGFDASIGHHRRYTLDMLRSLTPSGASIERALYLDSVGMLASMGNRFLLQSSMPSSAQVQLWDRVMVRLSKALDRILRFKLGKSVLVVWGRDGPS